MLEVRDVLAEVVGARRCSFRVDRADRFDRVVDVLTGDEAESNLPSEPPCRQSPHEGSIDHTEDQVAQHEMIVGARASQKEKRRITRFESYAI